ncbi:hypothetical protein GCM10007874_22480 [Labrys miyagiensis]|uniref:Uncharacterized protein n=1 Tax=Labrys miyagiensis TaxID=346912 RepID=A0ABQ6CG48_9HYPH|nr:hypothetical protein [Labrys miyagiensis]GLS19231.1 hypothetical protein GCM10007874_22480 [Labrys miyagiensis]
MTLDVQKKQSFLTIARRGNLLSFFALAGLALFSVLGSDLSDAHDANGAICSYGAAILAAGVLAFERWRQGARLSAMRECEGERGPEYPCIWAGPDSTVNAHEEQQGPQLPSKPMAAGELGAVDAKESAADIPAEAAAQCPNYCNICKLCRRTYLGDRLYCDGVG